MHPRGKDFEVLEENWPAVQLFVASSSQWRFSQGVPVGLDYGGVSIVAGSRKIKLDGQLLGRLQVMEQAAGEKLREPQLREPQWREHGK